MSDELGARFAAAGHELHLVGGSVRDALLGRLEDDLDFTTDARPDQVLALVAGWADGTWDTGIDFGTVGVMKSGFRLEITTFRSDLYDGDTRNPVVTFGDSLTGDLQRRDFAVNAMAVSLPGHDFADPFGGLDQLAARVLDTPGTPQQSFRDDPLRMLRAARFASQLSFTPAPRVVQAMTDDGRRDRPDHRRTGRRRVRQADHGGRSAQPASPCSPTPGWPSGSCPSCRRCGWSGTSTSSTRTSTSTR